MKNYFKFKHILMCVLLVSYSCTTDDAKENAVENQLKESQDLSSSARGVKLNQLEKPKGLISTARAVELNQNWNVTRVKAVETSRRKSDNQSVQFSLQELRNYLDYAKNETKQLGYVMDGVRIYFAAYGEHETLENAGMTTLFFVPTGSKNSNNEASVFNVKLRDAEKVNDIPGARGLNMGGNGYPPKAEYPQTNNGSRTSVTNATQRQSNKPKGLISPERAIELNQNWNQTRVKAIANTLGRVDNQSVQFSLEEVLRYLDYAEYEAKSLGYSMDGVRLYFAAYGEHEAQENAGIATLFFVSTGSKTRKSQDSIFISTGGDDHGDIPGASAMNMGRGGQPPTANYPQVPKDE